jgi:peptidoglycan/LPS O-acetylase OafA/YrhL
MEKAVTALKATGTPANRDAFRQDINALRAFSVIAVVGYHVQIPGFAGGFGIGRFGSSH